MSTKSESANATESVPVMSIVDELTAKRDALQGLDAAMFATEIAELNMQIDAAAADQKLGQVLGELNITAITGKLTDAGWVFSRLRHVGDKVKTSRVGGNRPARMYDGQPFRSAAGLCRKLGYDVEGRSGVRILARHGILWEDLPTA